MRKNFKRVITTAVLCSMMGLSLAGCKKDASSDAVTSASAETTVAAETTQAAEAATTVAETTAAAESTTAEPDTVYAPATEIPVIDYASLSSATSLSPKGDTVRSYFTGEWINDYVAYRRPLAVMLNNIQGGLPQRGISKADVIVEGQCEGGITRLMGIFQNYDEIDSIGSIRSCRDYFPFMAAEFDAAYYHFGQSDFALEFLSDPKLMTFNGMNGRYNYVRRSDRVSPHNVFTTPSDLVNAMVNVGLSTYLDEGFVSPFKFNQDSAPLSKSSGYDCNRIDIGYAYNSAYFVYNSTDHKYYRYEYGAPQIDEMTGEQVCVENIIIKLVPGQQYWNGSPLYILTGYGEGLYISEGKASWLSWEKETQGVNTNLGCEYTYGYDPTIYKYITGEDLILNRGNTWICIVETQNKDNIKITK